jgi:glucose-6-phosphate-specific signal transduction histidine kinase
VRIETLAGADGLDRGCITVEDDGQGFEIASDGAAAGSIKAARCGAELELSSCAQGPHQGDHQGTRVRLTLPHRFPDSDGAAG